MTATIIEIIATSSEGEGYHVKGKHLHMLQVSVYGWLTNEHGNRTYWLENPVAELNRDTAVVYGVSEDGSYLVDEKATRANLLAAYPDAEIRWATEDEPSKEALATDPPELIELCITTECANPNCILVGARPATARLRRRADHEWLLAGKGRTPAERYAEKLRHDRVLARAEALDPADDSLAANQIRDCAASIRDHRESEAFRAKYALEDARA